MRRSQRAGLHPTRNRASQKWQAAWWAAALIVCCGCGSNEGAKLAPAGGVVTYQGKPLADVNVMFMPRTGAPATATTDAEGKFELITLDQAGAAIGAHQVTITPNQGPIEMPLPGQPPAKPKSSVPQKYTRAETSGLTADVKAGEENRFEFKLVE